MCIKDIYSQYWIAASDKHALLLFSSWTEIKLLQIIQMQTLKCNMPIIKLIAVWDPVLN